MGIKVAENMTILKNIEKLTMHEPKPLPPIKPMLETLNAYCEDLDTDQPTTD